MSQALFRRLLVRVHPDVVAAKSDRFRMHNETTLKVLMACLDPSEEKKQANPRLQFFLRDGGKTDAVLFDRKNPLLSLQKLLGEAPAFVPPKPKQETSKEKGKSQEEELREMHRAMQESVNRWWSRRARLVTNQELLFKQNRIRYVPDDLDWAGQVDPKGVHQFQIASALDLVKAALELHVEDNTVDALVEVPELQNIGIRVVGKNLYKPERRDKTLVVVPLGCPPQLLGKELDKMVNDQLLVLLRSNPESPEKMQE
jgi:hypothetical protein